MTEILKFKTLFIKGELESGPTNLITFIDHNNNLNV